MNDYLFPRLSAVRKVPETITFQALGIIETLGSIISHGTSWIAEIIHWIISPNVHTHLRKVSKKSLSISQKSLSQCSSFFFLINFKSTGVEAVIGATFCHQGSMVASLDNTSVVHYHNHIGIDNRR